MSYEFIRLSNTHGHTSCKFMGLFGDIQGPTSYKLIRLVMHMAPNPMNF
jgi:hypothetical protein